MDILQIVIFILIVVIFIYCLREYREKFMPAHMITGAYPIIDNWYTGYRRTYK